MTKNLNKILDNTAISILCLAIGISLWAIQGVRKTEDVYKTTYLGKSAVVQHEDRRFDVDKYWILLNNKDKVTGTITDDNRKTISVYNNWFTSGYNVQNEFLESQ